MSPSTTLGRFDLSIWNLNCGHDMGNACETNVPKPVARGCGGFKRREPVGGCANGIPLKLSTPRKEVPIIVPLAMTTDGAACLLSWPGSCMANAEPQRRIMEKSMLSERRG